MRTVRVLALSVLAVVAASFQAKAQEIFDNTDHIDIHLPYTVMAGQQQLAPGDYELKLISQTARIFGLYKDGTQFETFLTAVPAERVVPANHTELTLLTDGHEFVMDTIWITGSDIGYQFLSPESAKARAHERVAELIVGN
jgi:hypothetical protein